MILRHPGIAQVQSDIHTASVDSKIPFGRTHRNYTAGRFQRGLFCFWPIEQARRWWKERERA
jgi:hypothetical protein